MGDCLFDKNAVGRPLPMDVGLSLTATIRKARSTPCKEAQYVEISLHRGALISGAHYHFPRSKPVMLRPGSLPAGIVELLFHKIYGGVPDDSLMSCVQVIMLREHTPTGYRILSCLFSCLMDNVSVSGMADRSVAPSVLAQLLPPLVRCVRVVLCSQESSSARRCSANRVVTIAQTHWVGSNRQHRPC